MLAAMARNSRYNGWQVGHVWQLADPQLGGGQVGHGQQILQV
jgi:hypothetical protein